MHFASVNRNTCKLQMHLAEFQEKSTNVWKENCHWKATNDMIRPYQVLSIFEDWNASTCTCTFFDKSVIDASLTNINQAKQLRNLLLCSPQVTTSCWSWRSLCSPLVIEDTTWCHEGLLLLWCSADAVGSFCGSACEKLWDLWHSLRPLGLSSVSVSLLMKHWGGKKSASLDSLSVSREQSESLLCSVKEKKRKKWKGGQESKMWQKKVQSESLCNCSHLVLPSATAALFLLARWSGCYFMCQGKLTACSCSSTLTDFSRTVASGHSYQRPTGTATIATASNRVIFFHSFLWMSYKSQLVLFL